MSVPPGKRARTQPFDAKEFGTAEFQIFAEELQRARRKLLDSFDTNTKSETQKQIDEYQVQIDGCIEAFITEENAIVDRMIGEWGIRGERDLRWLRKAVWRLTPASAKLRESSMQLIAESMFCAKEAAHAEIKKLTATQQAVFAACNPRLAWRMPAFAVAAQPGAGKTLMSVLGCVRWVIGGVAEARYYQKVADAPRPFVRFEDNFTTFRFVQPKSATCMYVVPKAVLPQTIDNFTKLTGLFGLTFEKRGPEVAHMGYAWEPPKFPDPATPGNIFAGLAKTSPFWLQECEDYWFAPMCMQQLYKFNKESAVQRMHNWKKSIDETKAFKEYFREQIDFTPAKLRYKNEFELRIAFFALEDLLLDNLNHDHAKTMSMTPDDYFTREKQAYLRNGLQLFATPRVRYMVVDEFHMPLEQVTVEGSQVQGFFAHPGASNFLNLIGSKTLNSHVFSNTTMTQVTDQPNMFWSDVNARQESVTQALKVATTMASGDPAGQKTVADISDKLRKKVEEVYQAFASVADACVANAASSQPVARLDPLYQKSNDITTVLDPTSRDLWDKCFKPSGLAFSAAGQSHSPFPFKIDRNKSEFLTDYYGTQTLLMTGTPPNSEATALWLALVQPAAKLTGLKSGGYVLQDIRVPDENKTPFSFPRLRPAFLWRYSSMKAQDGATVIEETQQMFDLRKYESDRGEPLTEYGRQTRTAPPESGLDKSPVGQRWVKDFGSNFSVTVSEAANQGCVIAFVGSKQTTPYWHYEFRRGKFPVIQMEGNAFKVVEMRPNGLNGAACEDLALSSRKTDLTGAPNQGKADDLYNTMLYGQICPTRVVPTDTNGIPVEIEDWQNVWRTIIRVLTDIADPNGVLVDPSKIIAESGLAAGPDASWEDYQKEFLRLIKQQPRVVIVYAGPARQWPVFLDSVPDEDGGAIGWLAPEAFSDPDRLRLALGGATQRGSGMLRTTPAEGFLDDEKVSNALQMGVDNKSVNLFVLNAHSSTGIDLPGINVVLYVGDEGNKEQMLSRSSRLCRPMTGIGSTAKELRNGLGSFVVIQILPRATEYRFTSSEEVQQRKGLTQNGIEHCFSSDTGICAEN